MKTKILTATLCLLFFLTGCSNPGQPDLLPVNQEIPESTVLPPEKAPLENQTVSMKENDLKAVPGMSFPSKDIVIETRRTRLMVESGVRETILYDRLSDQRTFHAEMIWYEGWQDIPAYCPFKMEVLIYGGPDWNATLVDPGNEEVRWIKYSRTTDKDGFPVLVLTKDDEWFESGTYRVELKNSSLAVADFIDWQAKVYYRPFGMMKGCS